MFDVKMKSIQLLSILLLSSIAETRRPSIIQCPPNPQDQSFLPHQFERSNFFFCGVEVTGEPVTILRCRYNEVFNPRVPGLCSRDLNFQEEVPTYPIEKISNFNNADYRCSVPNPDSKVHIPHESDCTKFYQCVWGTAVLFQCPSGLHFNEELEVCDWPERAGCDPKVCHENSDPECPRRFSLARLPHQNKCNWYYQCLLGFPIRLTCWWGWHFNPKTLTCMSASTANCKLEQC